MPLLCSIRSPPSQFSTLHQVRHPKVMAIVKQHKLLTQLGHREHRKFPDFPLNPLWNWDVKKTKVWIKSKMAEFHKYQGKFRAEVDTPSITPRRLKPLWMSEALISVCLLLHLPHHCQASLLRRCSLIHTAHTAISAGASHMPTHGHLHWSLSHAHTWPSPLEPPHMLSQPTHGCWGLLPPPLHTRPSPAHTRPSPLEPLTCCHSPHTAISAGASHMLSQPTHGCWGLSPPSLLLLLLLLEPLQGTE